MSPDRARTPIPFAAHVSIDTPEEASEGGPSSEVRPVDATVRVRSLLVSTSLRGVAAADAWVSVTDAAGAILFQGAPGDDGCITVSFEEAPNVDRVYVLLETARSHRQAEVSLGEGCTELSFDGALRG
jgi:hypothetical protein